MGTLNGWSKKSSLLAFLDEVYAPRRQLAPRTVVSYQVSLRFFARFLGYQPTLADLTEEQLQAFIASLLMRKSPVTAWTERKGLLALANYAHRRGLIRCSPEVEQVKIGRRVPTAYSVVEMGRLMAGAQTMPGDVGVGVRRIPAAHYWPALFICAYDTGARAGALLALEWADFDPSTPSLLFRAEHAKTRVDQLLRISGEAAAALETIREPPRPRIFGGIYAKRAFYSRLRRVFVAAGLPSGRRDLLQRIRRTTATLMHRYGADATAQLGHSSDSMTRDHYLDPTAELQAVDVLPRPVCDKALSGCSTAVDPF